MISIVAASVTLVFAQDGGSSWSITAVLGAIGTFVGGILGAWGAYLALKHRLQMSMNEQRTKLRQQDAETDKGLAEQYNDFINRLERRDTHWEKVVNELTLLVNDLRDKERECYASMRSYWIWIVQVDATLQFLTTIAKKEGYEVSPLPPRPDPPPQFVDSTGFKARSIQQSVQTLKETQPLIQPTGVPAPEPPDKPPDV